MKESLAKSGAVSLLGASFAAISALVVTSLVGHALGAAGTGVFFQAIGFFAIVTAILKLGTTSGLVWSISRQRAFEREGTETQSLLIALLPVTVASCLVGTAIYYFADPLAAWLSGGGPSDELADILRILAPLVVAAAVLGVLHSATRMMRGVVSFVVLQDLALPLSRLAGVGAAAVLGLGVVGTVGAWAATLPLWVLVSLAWLGRPIARDLRRRRETADREGGEGFGSFWRFSAPRALGVAIEFGLEWSDVLIVAAFRPPAEAGIYAVVTRAVTAGRVTDRAVRVAVSPSISHLLTLERKEEASRLHTTVTRGMLLVSWPFYLMLIVMAPAVLGLFGSEFSAGAGLLALTAVIAMGVTTTGVLQSILLMGGRSTWQVYDKGAALVVSIVCNLLLVPVLGAWGAALTRGIVAVVDNGIAGYLVHRSMGVHLAPRALLSAAVLPLLVFGALGSGVRAVTGTDLPDLLWYLVVVGGVYVLCLRLFRRRLGIEVLWDSLLRRRATDAPTGPRARA